MNRKKVFGVLCLLAAILMGGSIVSAAEKIDTDPKQQLPDPDKRAPDTKKPVKVFIMMGQSNMVGFGRIAPETTKGTLAYLAKKEGEYSHLLDSEGNCLPERAGVSL